MAFLKKSLLVARLMRVKALVGGLLLVVGFYPSAEAAQLYAYSQQTISNLNFNAVPGAGGGTEIFGLTTYTSASSAALPTTGDAATDLQDVRESFTGPGLNPGQNYFLPVGISANNYARGDALLNTGAAGSPFQTVAETSFNALGNSSASNANYSIRVTFTVNTGSFTLTPTLTYANTLTVSTGGSATALARANYAFDISISRNITGANPFYDVTPVALNNVQVSQPDSTLIQGPTNLTLSSVTVGPGSYVLAIVGSSTVSATQLTPVFPTAVVPEPATLVSAATAFLLGLVQLRRMRRRAVTA